MHIMLSVCRQNNVDTTRLLFFILFLSIWLPGKVVAKTQSLIESYRIMTILVREITIKTGSGKARMTIDDAFKFWKIVSMREARNRK